MTNEFKKLTDVDMVDTVTENTNVIVDDNGMVRRASMALFGSGAVSDEQIDRIVDAVVDAIEQNSGGSGGGAKILYMDADLLNAGGVYPADADDYTTAVIPAEAAFVDYEVFKNLPLIDTIIINGDAEFEEYIEYYDKNTIRYNALTNGGLPFKKIVIKDRTTGIPDNFVAGRDTNFVLEIENCNGIGDYAFNNCVNMRSATLTNVTGRIGYSAFRNCKNLTEFVIPDGVTIISMYAFDDCKSLEQISIPSSVTAIDNYAFEYCPKLMDVIIPEGVESIGEWAFSDACIGGSITIPRSVTSIGEYPFSSATLLRVYSGSYAETWAQENHGNYEVIE